MTKFIRLLLISLLLTTAASALTLPMPIEPSEPSPARPPAYPGQPPPPPPGYNDIYGPGYTARWWDLGTINAQKFVTFDVKLNMRNQFVNELYLEAEDNHIEIKSAQARLVNGQTVDLAFLNGTIRKGQQFRTRMDYYYSLRIDTLYFKLSSPNPFGSSGKLKLQAGLAY